jgi:hypothetical protein
MGKTMDEIADIIFSEWSKEERDYLSRRCEVEENEYITIHGGKLYEGVRETLVLLKEKGVPMAVVSNCQEGYIKAFMESMNMHEFFVDYEEWGRTGRGKAENIRLVMERNSADKAVYGLHFLPILSEFCNTGQTCRGDAIIFPQPAPMLRLTNRQHLCGLQAFQNGVKGRFGKLQIGLHVLYDPVAVGLLILDGRQNTNIQKSPFQLYIHSIPPITRYIVS